MRRGLGRGREKSGPEEEEGRAKKRRKGGQGKERDGKGEERIGEQILPVSPWFPAFFGN